MPMVSRRARFSQVVTGCAVALTLLVAGCGNGDSGRATPPEPAPSATSAAQPTDDRKSTVTVDVSNMAFTPADLTVKVGDTVTWRFADKAPHTVQGIGDKAMGINSPIIDKGDWSYTFTTAGTYRYLCSLHPEMRGTVTVR